MPLRPTKRQKVTESHLSTPLRTSPQLPALIVAEIVMLAVKLTPAPSQKRIAAELSFVSRDSAAVLRATRLHSVSIASVGVLQEVESYFKKWYKHAALVRELFVSLEDIYALGNKGTTAWKGHALNQLLRQLTSLTALSINLGPTNFSDPFQFLDLASALSGLSTLKSFIFCTSEFWLPSLAHLFDAWPGLEYLEISYLRASCHSDSFHPPATLTQVKLPRSTLSNAQIRSLLKNLAALTHLELAIPGCEDMALFAALKQIAPNLTRLALSDQFGKPATPRLDGAPLLAVLRSATRLEELALAASFVGANEIELILTLPVFDTLVQLTIEDTTASGMRDAVGAALEVGKLSQLKVLVSVGSNKASSKEFEALCRRKGVEWTLKKKA